MEPDPLPTPSNATDDGPTTHADLMGTRRAILDALERAADGVVRESLDRISALLPYHAMPPAMRDEVAITVEWILQLFVSCLRTSRSLSQGEVAELRDFGMRRAQMGIPLASVTQAFEVAFEISQSALIRIATRPDLPAATAVLPSLSTELIPLSRAAIHAIEVGHSARPAQLPQQILKDRTTLAEELLAEGLPVTEIADRAARLGLTAGPTPALIVAIPTERTPLPALGHATDELAGTTSSALAAFVRKTPATHAVVLSLAPMPASTQRLLSKVSDRHDLTIVHAGGTGDPTPPAGADGRGRLSYAGLPAAYADVRAHLPVPARLLRGPGVMDLENFRDLLPLAAIPEEVARREIRRTLTPLPGANASDPCLGTLHVLIDTRGNAKQAATILGINERTVRSRAQAAAEARGRTLSDPHDLDVLRRALYLARLHGTTDYT